jgi:drug/metabolite transporter (DMT)-like permease
MDLQLSKKKVIANILLILTTLLWGSSFIITKNITDLTPVFLYLAVRFIIATIGFAPFLVRLKRFNFKILWMGFLTGFIYFLGISTQTIGIQTTTAGKTGFITGLSTIMVPFITWIFLKKPPKRRIWIAVVLSVIGMGFLFLEGESMIIIGDLFVLMCALMFAIYIILNDKYVKLLDVYLYSFVQTFTIAIFSVGSSLLLSESFNLLSVDYTFWIIMTYMGVAVMTFTVLFQNWSQQYVGPSQTAIIFTLEPVFAVLFASFLIGDEAMTIWGWSGSILIFIAILITVIKFKNNKFE